MTVTAIIGRPKVREIDIQSFTVDLLTKCGVPDLIWFHVPNQGTHKSPKIGATLKRMGVKAGVADFVIVSPANMPAGGLALGISRTPALPHFLELKSADGRQSKAQRDFEILCRANGSHYAVARTTDDVQRVLTEWGALRKTPPTAARMRGQ